MSLLSLVWAFALLVCVSGTSLTAYSPVSFGTSNQYLNITYKVVGGTCSAGTVQFVFLNRNTSSIDRLTVNGGTSLTNYIRFDTTNITATAPTKLYNTTTSFLPNGVYNIDICCVSAGVQVCATRILGFHVLSTCPTNPTATGYGATAASGCLTCSTHYVQTSVPCINCTSGWYGPFCNISAADCRVSRCNGHADCSEKDDFCGPCDNHYAGVYCEIARGKSSVDTWVIGLVIGVAFVLVLGGMVACVTFGSNGGPKIATTSYSSVQVD